MTVAINFNPNQDCVGLPPLTKGGQVDSARSNHRRHMGRPIDRFGLSGQSKVFGSDHFGLVAIFTIHWPATDKSSRSLLIGGHIGLAMGAPTLTHRGREGGGLMAI